jgi:glycosyltransferase involved in cell wall biosynthesis
MRVLHVLAQLRASGAEQMLRTAAPYWLGAGLELVVLETSEQPGHFHDQLRQAGFDVERLHLRRRPSDVSALRRFIRAGRYDVVHVHPEGADLIPVLAARLEGTPAIIRTVHHIYPYEGLLQQRKRLERRVSRRLGTRHICNSRSGSENETTTLHNPHRLVFNWYDEEHFRPPTDEQRQEARAALGLGPDDVAFVSVGGCAPYKNHDLILRALVQVPDAIYLHAGAEPDGAERQLAEELGLRDRARFLGVVSDARDVFHAADGYLMPSTIEGFGVAAVEAMGCGVPAILSDRPALWDLKALTPGRWVALSADELAKSMRDLLSTPRAEREAEGARASQAVRDRFGARVGAEGYLAAYEEALACARR